MTPTPDFTEVWRAINNGHWSLTSQRLADSLNNILAISCVLMLLTFVIIILGIKYRKEIKGFLNL